MQKLSTNINFVQHTNINNTESMTFHEFTRNATHFK